MSSLQMQILILKTVFQLAYSVSWPFHFSQTCILCISTWICPADTFLWYGHLENPVKATINWIACTLQPVCGRNNPLQLSTRILPKISRLSRYYWKSAHQTFIKCEYQWEKLFTCNAYIISINIKIIFHITI